MGFPTCVVAVALRAMFWVNWAKSFDEARKARSAEYSPACTG